MMGRNRNAGKPGAKNPGKTFKRIFAEIMSKYKVHCIAVVICLLISAVANVYGTMFMQRLIDDYITPMMGQPNPDFGPMGRAVLGVAAMMAVLLPVAGSSVATIVVCCVWGAFYTAYNVAFQAEVISNAPEGTTMVAMSAYSGIFNIGIGAGTWIGGVVVAGGGIADVGLVGAAIGVAAGLVCTFQLVRAIKREEAKVRA